MKRGILAFLGDPTDAAQILAAAKRSGLRQICGMPGLSVFAGDGIVDRQLPDGSLLLGDIFPRTPGPCQRAADGWGNYLAFSIHGRATWVERAPLTGMPFYWARRRDGILFTSHLHLAEDLLPQLTIDWAFVAQAMSYINLRTERTGLAGFEELLAGTRLEIDGDSVRTTLLWSPWDHVTPAPLAYSDLAAHLEACLIDCVGAWSAPRPHIVLELSGGLDSSVVAAALSGSGHSFTAINFVTTRADGDERRYARAVATRCGSQMIEAMLGGEAADLVAPPGMLTARPTDYAVLRAIDTAFAKAPLEKSASIFSGIGGDNIFGFDGSVAPILDAFDRFGLSRRSYAALRDVARAANATLWTALALARQSRKKGPRLRWRRETLFLAADAAPLAPFVHPWDVDAPDVGQGKRNHVEAVRRILDFIDRPARWYDRDVVAPLLSQPVVELCLAIPSWTWVNGGRDRAVARAAFARRLPPEVVWRRGKGRIESVAAAAYLAQRTDLRELLLGGHLTLNGLLDGRAIDSYLARDIQPDDYDYFRLLEIADVERWVRAITESSFVAPSRPQRIY